MGSAISPPGKAIKRRPIAPPSWCLVTRARHGAAEDPHQHLSSTTRLTASRSVPRIRHRLLNARNGRSAPAANAVPPKPHRRSVVGANLFALSMPSVRLKSHLPYAHNPLIFSEDRRELPNLGSPALGCRRKQVFLEQRNRQGGVVAAIAATPPPRWKRVCCWRPMAFSPRPGVPFDLYSPRVTQVIALRSKP